jgi:hypothetical protein
MDGQLDLLARAGLAPALAPAPRRPRGAGRRGAAAALSATGGGLFDALVSHVPPSAPVAAKVEAFEPPSMAAPPITPVIAHEVPIEADPERPSFGAWLLAQRGRRGAMGELIEGARRDPAFPKAGDPDAVRGRLEAVQAEGEVFAALDAAEREWFRG